MIKQSIITRIISKFTILAALLLIVTLIFDVLPLSPVSASVKIVPHEQYNTSVAMAGWDYCMPFTIDNTTNANNLTDYQVDISVDTAALITAGKMLATGDDIRFTTADGVTEIPFWSANLTDCVTNPITVKVPYIAASTNTIIYMFYGNPTATVTEVPPVGFNTFTARTVVLSETNGAAAKSVPENIQYDPVTTKYWMIYSNVTDGEIDMAYADTIDGAWTVDADNPVIPALSYSCHLQYVTATGKWYIFIFGVGGMHLWKSDTVNGTYTDLGVIIAGGAAGKFDYVRVTEPYVYQEDDGTWTCFYMGDSNGGNIRPQETVGFATTATSDIEGTWTKANSGNPVVTFGVNTEYMTADAAAGQKDVTVADGSVFVAGEAVNIADGVATELTNTIASISGNVLTMTSNLANTYTTAACGFVTRGVNNIDEYAIADPWIYKFKGIYYMGYCGGGRETGATNYGVIPALTCYASSTDKIHWTKYGLLLGTGSPSTLGTNYVWRGSVSRVGDVYYFIYGSDDGAGKYRGCMATMSAIGISNHGYSPNQVFVAYDDMEGYDIGSVGVKGGTIFWYDSLDTGFTVADSAYEPGNKVLLSTSQAVSILKYAHPYGDPNYIVDFRAAEAVGATAHLLELLTDAADATSQYRAVLGYSGNLTISRASLAKTTMAEAVADSTFYHWQVRRFADTIYLDKAGVNKLSWLDTVAPYPSRGPGIMNVGAAKRGELDTISVRKYSYPEPSSSSGGEMTFPSVTTLDIISIAMDKDGVTSGSFSMNITSLGGDSSVSYWWDYGLTASYGSVSANITDNTTGVKSLTIPSSLIPGQTYHCRAVVANTVGIGVGLDTEFTFTMPSVTTNIGANGNLNGELTSLGVAFNTYVYFEYGETISYGNSTALVTKNSTGTFSDTIPFDVDHNTHFRTVVKNGSVYSYGTDQSYGPLVSIDSSNNMAKTIIPIITIIVLITFAIGFLSGDITLAVIILLGLGLVIGVSFLISVLSGLGF